MDNIDYKQKYLQTLALLDRSKDHHEYCGYGDTWERECSDVLQKDLELFFAREDVTADLELVR